MSKPIQTNRPCNACSNGHHKPTNTNIRDSNGVEQALHSNGCVAQILFKAGFTEHPESHCSCFRENKCQEDVEIV